MSGRDDGVTLFHVVVFFEGKNAPLLKQCKKTGSSVHSAILYIMG